MIWNNNKNLIIEMKSLKNNNLEDNNENKRSLSVISPNASSWKMKIINQIKTEIMKIIRMRKKKWKIKIIIS